jgi:hypothetical protein
MITEQDFAVPTAITEGLKMAAICHTTHKGVAAIALLRAAADILCSDFGPEQTCEIIQHVTVDALKVHAMANAPAGHA